MATVTISEVVDQEYKVNGGTESYEIFFTNSDEVMCPLIYQMSYPFSAEFMLPLSGTKVMWQTDQNSDSGTYAISVTASSD